jgi:hypothetical protein
LVAVHAHCHSSSFGGRAILTKGYDSYEPHRTGEASQPPAMAPMTTNGSSPAATASAGHLATGAGGTESARAPQRHIAPATRQTLPAMVEVAGRHARLNLLNLEAVAMGHVLGATPIGAVSTRSAMRNAPLFDSRRTAKTATL